MFKRFWEGKFALLLILLITAFVAGGIILINRFPWLLLVFLGLVLLAYPINKLQRARSLRKKGYFVNLIKNGWHYEELADGVLRSVLLCERSIGPEPALVIPSLVEWKGRVPLWAAGRREELFRKMNILLHGDVSYPQDWDFSPEELEKKQADEMEAAAQREMMRKDLRIGDPESSWQEEITDTGASRFTRKPGM